jgi:fatty-acyl-CoA synthase
MTDWIEVSTLGDLLLRTAERRAHHEALVFPDESFTYAEVADRAEHAARRLAGLGVRRGDHVGLLMPNSPDFVFSFFGAQLLGAVVVPINTRFRVRELSYVIDNADLVVLLTSDVVEDHVDFAERLHESLPGLPGATDPEDLRLPGAPRLRAVGVLGASRPPGLVSERRLDELAAGVEDAYVSRERAAVRVRGIALAPFTSGTTAQPKACLLTHEAVARSWLGAGRMLDIREDDRVYAPLPLFHMGCIGPMTFTFACGATLITAQHFEPTAALALIERARATWLYTVFPPIIMGLVRHPRFAEHDLSAVRAMLNVAPLDTLRIFQEALPQAVQVNGHFGMTECAGAITSNRFDDAPEPRAATNGPPLPGMEVRAIDPETGREAAPRERGELQIRGPGLLEGYHKDPERTASVFTDDGWLRSGDLGVIDEAGRVTFTGRLKDMLKVGGENVAPAEIEAHLSTHPAIKLVQVVGAPDERLGEVVAAFVELVPGRELTAEEVVSYCKGQIASFKVPRHVRFLEEDEWPMSATKVQKFRLAERLADELGAGAASKT